MPKSIDLNVSNSDQITAIMRNASDQFNESHSELQSAWQDEDAGRVWREFAKALDRGVASIDALKMPHETRELLEEDNFDLDVGTPEEFPNTLKEAARHFREQPKKSVWYKIGIVLDRIARVCDNAVRKYV